MNSRVNNQVVDLVTHVAKALVSQPDALQINVSENDRSVILELRVAQEDMGRVIGKHGRVAKALRTVVKSATLHEKKKYTVEII